MTPKQPKQTLSAIAALLLLTFVAISCNNSADTSKSMTDSPKTAMDTPATMMAPADSMKKMDTSRIDTGTTRPVKTTN